jgi:hypothetical protein
MTAKQVRFGDAAHGVRTREEMRGTGAESIELSGAEA